MSQRGWAIPKGFDKSDFELIPEALRNRTLCLHQTLAWEGAQFCVSGLRSEQSEWHSSTALSSCCRRSARCRSRMFPVLGCHSLTTRALYVISASDASGCSVMLLHSRAVDSELKRTKGTSVNDTVRSEIWHAIRKRIRTSNNPTIYRQQCVFTH